MRGRVQIAFTDKHLSEVLVFGQKLVGTKPGERGEADSISRARQEVITAPRKADAAALFDGDGKEGKSSYISDTYETHVEDVRVDAGCEIRPQRKHPHMHILLTVNEALGTYACII
jgi:hypothetical protein